MLPRVLDVEDEGKGYSASDHRSVRNEQLLLKSKLLDFLFSAE